MEAVKTFNLTKFYGFRVGVENLNLEVLSGETFGFLGPNGSGKTTTVRLLNCIIRPTSGGAKVGGYDILSESEVVKRITGLLPEVPGVYERLTAREFLEFMGSLYDVPSAVLKRRIAELLDFFELGDRADELLEGFSKGMKQKVLLASAFIHDPEIVFLDEPTSGLDPISSRMVKDLVKMLASETNKTFFICTHILPLAEELCERIAIIDRGRLKEVGSPDELKEKYGAKNLEEVFLQVTGRNVSRDMIEWV
ncbi:MAG: ABC transporter ATP-binding protein [Candidatus Freyarchaeota archaeon]|nr:ABC transporter ATP-binding protein [Candidatus Jordarchaeia archaeon]